MTDVVSVEPDGGATARSALERCVGSGGVVAFPADGLYGLGCDPLDAGAIARIHTLKGRDDGTPSAVMYFAPLVMREALGQLAPRSRQAIAALLPGPATVVVANPERRYPLACRADPERLGLRLIDGPLTGARTPIFQTSANRSGEPPPSRFEEINVQILGGVDLAIDGGELTGLPSTVVDLTRLDLDGTWSILREGGLPADELSDRMRAIADAAAADAV